MKALPPQGAISTYLHIPYEITNAHIEGVCDQLERSQGHTLLPALQPVEVHSIQAGKLGKLILSDRSCLANLLDPFADNPLNILQPIRL
jgi:hypothetical protein